MFFNFNYKKNKKKNEIFPEPFKWKQLLKRKDPVTDLICVKIKANIVCRKIKNPKELKSKSNGIKIIKQEGHNNQLFEAHE